MKKKTLFTFGAFLMAILFATTSCNKIKDAVASHIPDQNWAQPDVTLTVPASSNTDQQTAWGTLKFDLNQWIQDNAPSDVKSLLSGNALAKVKHIYLTSITATALNGDANNNFQNLDFGPDVNPTLAFNTTPNPATSTYLSAATTPPADPFTLNFPASNNTDILKHVNGTDWAYMFTYRLQKPTTKDLQVNFKVNYKISFSD